MAARQAGDARWSGWLPHLDLAVARAFTASSADHDRLWRMMERPGRLMLRTKLDLWQMLRPAVQPGSTTGYTLPDEEVTLIFSGPGPIDVATPAGSSPLGAGADGRYRVRVTANPRRREPVPVAISMATSGPAALELTWSTARGRAAPRAAPASIRFCPGRPWRSNPRRSTDRDIPELKGGDWVRGRALFHGDQSKCGSCHKVRGRGGEIGPDLSNLVHRDYASVFRDIHTPSAAINPDYISHSIAMADGRVLVGTLRTDGDRLIVGDSAGRTNGRRSLGGRRDIALVGLDHARGPRHGVGAGEAARPADVPADRPDFARPPSSTTAPRRLVAASELDAVLKGSVAAVNPRRLRIVLSAGPKDHGPGEHDYPLWRKRWSALFAMDEAVDIETADGWPAPRQLETADVIVFYSNNPGWDASKAAELDRYLARGGGVVLIHYAVDGHSAVGALADRIGLAWQGGKSAFRHGPLDIDFSTSKHPIARGFSKLRLVDESYWNLVGDPGSVEVIGTGSRGRAGRVRSSGRARRERAASS